MTEFVKTQDFEVGLLLGQLLMYSGMKPSFIPNIHVWKKIVSTMVPKMLEEYGYNEAEQKKMQKALDEINPQQKILELQNKILKVVGVAIDKKTGKIVDGVEITEDGLRSIKTGKEIRDDEEEFKGYEIGKGS